MHHLKSVCLLLVGVAILTSRSNAATIVWAAAADNGFAAADGSMVPAGNLVRVGSFNITDQQIVANQTDISFLNSNFVEFGSARFGQGVGAPGYFTATSNANPDAGGLNVAGKQIYVWAFLSGDNSSNAQSLATVAQHSILYMPFAADPDWMFPTDVPVPGATTIDISDLTRPDAATLDPLAKLLVGTFPSGPNGTLNSQNFALVVPEPGTTGLLVLSTIGFLGVRRRRLA